MESTTEIRVTVWGENVHENTHPEVGGIYPRGMHTCIAEALMKNEPRIQSVTATLQELDHGLTPERLAQTDVLTWWGHCAHHEVADAVVDRVAERVWQGMGLIVLHSGHHSKIFRKLMGTTGSLTWREAGEKERLWVCNPGHPIAQGIDRYLELEHEEMYGEPFAIPAPDEQVFISWFSGGEVFRSGCTWKRGNGKIFYFRPGHETYPTYHHPMIQRILTNAVLWARPEGSLWVDSCPNIPVEKAPEKIEPWGGSVH